MAEMVGFPHSACPHCNGPMMPRLDFTAGTTTATCQRGCTDRAEAKALRKRVEALEAQRDEAIGERDEMRKANVTPEDADRPLGQSVEYWQDRCLDHATALDRARAQRDEALKALSPLEVALVEHVDLTSEASVLRDHLELLADLLQPNKRTTE